MLPTLTLLVACTRPADSPARRDDSAPAVDTSLPSVPPETGDSAEPEAPPLQTAPGSATLDCATAPVADGKVDCTLHVEDQDGVVQWDGTAGVSLHGRSSASFPKPQFSIELRDEAGADLPADLFGMGEESDWILNGMYIDRALFRNKLCFDLYRSLTDDAEWAPESVYVELTYQGAYFGVYQLEERVEHGEGRAPVADNDGTGSAFIVRGDESGYPSTLQDNRWALVYPSEANQTAEVIDGVRERLQAAEAAIAAEDASTWEQVDLDSAVAFILMEEFMKNNDAYYLSHHAYVAEDGKLHFTPWDVDLSFGQPSYNDNENPESWILYRPALEADMALAPGFHERMASTWATWRATELSDATIDATLAANPALLGDAVDRNFERWPIGDIQFGGYLYAVSSYDEELARVSAFVHARLAWMDDNVASW